MIVDKTEKGFEFIIEDDAEKILLGNFLGELEGIISLTPEAEKFASFSPKLPRRFNFYPSPSSERMAAQRSNK